MIFYFVSPACLVLKKLNTLLPYDRMFDLKQFKNMKIAPRQEK